ncbi:unnamed protein product, partial [Rangifer tarandus platyrhynchus]
VRYMYLSIYLSICLFIYHLSMYVCMDPSLYLSCNFIILETSTERKSFLICHVVFPVYSKVIHIYRYIYTYNILFFRFFSIIGYCKIFNIAL